MLLSDVGEAWEVGKPQRKALFILFQACSQALGESEHHGDHLQYSWYMGLGKDWEAFQGAPLGGTGAWEASARGLGGSWHLATLRLVGRGAGWWCWGVVLIAAAGSWVMSLPPTAPEGCPGWLVNSQAIRELGS